MKIVEAETGRDDEKEKVEGEGEENGDLPVEIFGIWDCKHCL